MRFKPAIASLAGVMLIAGIGCFGQAWRVAVARDRPRITAPAKPSAPPQPPAPALTGSVAPTTSTAASIPPAATAAAPVRVEVPDVGISASIVSVGLTGDGGMEVPPPAVAGWYRLGPAPGAVGPAVLVGHVDSRSGPAVFYRLNAIRPGATVVVDRADGSQVRFLISAITVVSKSTFPTDAVFAPTPGAALRLISCTGVFDPIHRHYTDSVIAWGNAETL